jgi:4-amino-4-deoxy-L-arabinose transferase-like glycosyltransferase
MNLLPIISSNARISTSQIKVRPDAWVLFFILIGFGLRLQQLNLQPLWGDEGWSFYFAMQPFTQLLALTAIDIHPPLYYMLLKGWLAFVGGGAEEARFFSVIAGTVLIPVLALLGRRLFDERVGMVAAAVTAAMPLAIYYAQEVRMYGLVTLLATMSTYFFIKLNASRALLPAQTQFVNTLKRSSRQMLLLAYVATTAAALYTHYYAAFVVVAHFLSLFFGRFWQRLDKLVIYQRLKPFIYVGLIYLPWIIYAGGRLTRYVENKRGVEGYLPLSFTGFLTEHLIAFSLGHLPAELQDYRWTALSIIVIALLGILAAISLKNRRPLILFLYLFVPLFAGYLINLFYPFTPRFFERTLLLAAPAYWLLVAGGLVWLWDRHYLLSGLAAAAMLLVSCVSLIGFYSVQRYPHEDYRPLLAEIAARATPEDVVLASYQWQLGFYQAYLPSPRPHLFAVPGWGQGWSSQAGNAARLNADLNELFRQSPRLWFPAYQASGHIWEDEAEQAIAQFGYPALLHWYSPQTKLVLAGAQVHMVASPTANFENLLALREAEVGVKEYQAGRDIIPVRLVWQKLDSLGSDHYVSLRLTDSAGRTWTIRDSYPRGGLAFFTDLAIDETLVDPHGVLTPAGAPPGRYRLLLSIRRASDAHPLDLVDQAGQPLGAELLLAELNLVAPNPPVGAAALPVQVATEADFGRQVQLVGFSLGHGPFKAGEKLPLTLFWYSLVDQPGALTVLIELQDKDGQTVASFQEAPIWPATEWRMGAILRDPHDLILPPTLRPDIYHLLITLITPEQRKLRVNDAEQLELTVITTIDRPRAFEAPDPAIDLDIIFGQQVKLIGMDLPQSRLKAGETLPLTLYWQALAPLDKNWTVFVHLIDRDGHIITQQDQIPGAGQFPTTGWVPNEYLVDSYQLAVPADIAPDDETYLRIGLYDANDFSHLPVIEAGQSSNDYIVLESWPISVE